MKKTFIALLFLNSLVLFSQNLEVIGGVNYNRFFNFKEETPHFSSTYNTDLGYVIKFAIDDIKFEGQKLRFTLGYEKYGGEVQVNDGGLGGGYGVNTEINKSVLSLGIYPFNFKILKRIDFNLGIEVSGLLNETYKGTSGGWQAGEPNVNIDLNEKYDRFSSWMYIGISARIAYDIKIAENWAISPQYSYYLGLSNEFIEFPEFTKSMRHYFCIGIQKTLASD